MKFNPDNYRQFYGNVPDASSYKDPVSVVEKIPEILKTGSVLDLGAGDGRHALLLAEKGFTVKAVDLSEAGLDKLQRLAQARHVSVETERVDLTHWSIDGEYDAIVSTVVFQHLPTKQALRLLDEMKEHTNPGGVNAITVFTKNGDRYAFDQRPDEDPDAFYPDDGWLKDFYADWEVLDFDGSMKKIIGKVRLDGTPMENRVERILARKPSV